MLYLRLSLVLFLCSGLGAARAVDEKAAPSKRHEQDLRKQILRDTAPLERRSQVVLSYADVVEKARDSVVTILVTRSRPPVKEEDREENNFEILPKSNSEDEEEEDENQGSGSGVVFSSDGWIVTNAHVVRDAEKIQVRLRGQDDTLLAVLAGIDTATDIALLKVEQPGLSSATLGDSSQLRPGDVVLAIGSPFGLEQTITLGIISATGRGTLGLIEGGMEDFIQTDAAINPGNSGGPLLDGLGRVIGINTARYWGDNIGFAVPINLALKVAGDLHQYGWVVRGFLGVQTLKLTRKLRKELKLPPRTLGVAIKTVEVDEAGARAGILPGDLILEVNGCRVENDARFRLSLASLQPGDTATFKLLREGQQVTLQATLGDPPELKKSRSHATVGNLDTVEWAPGLKVAEINRDWRMKLKLSPQVQGLIVTQDFKAADGSIRLSAGDQILSINGKPVKAMKQAQLQLETLKSSTLLLKIRSAGEERLLAVLRQP